MTRRALLGGLTALLLTGCGRKGDLKRVDEKTEDADKKKKPASE